MGHAQWNVFFLVEGMKADQLSETYFIKICFDWVREHQQKTCHAYLADFGH